MIAAYNQWWSLAFDTLRKSKITYTTRCPLVRVASDQASSEYIHKLVYYYCRDVIDNITVKK